MFIKRFKVINVNWIQLKLAMKSYAVCIILLLSECIYRAHSVPCESIHPLDILFCYNSHLNVFTLNCIWCSWTKVGEVKQENICTYKHFLIKKLKIGICICNLPFAMKPQKAWTGACLPLYYSIFSFINIQWTFGNSGH